MSEIELEPCPFCGGEARTLPGLRRVYCFTATCGAEMSAATVEGAIRLWNTRSQSERVSRLEEALKAIADESVFNQQRFAEDDDTDYFLRCFKAVKERARSALNQGAGDGR